MASTAYLLGICAVVVTVDKQMGLIHGLNTALDTQPTSLQWYQDTGFSSLKSAADGDIDDLLIDVPIEHNHLRRGRFTPLLYPHAATIGV